MFAFALVTITWLHQAFAFRDRLITPVYRELAMNSFILHANSSYIIRFTALGTNPITKTGVLSWV